MLCQLRILPQRPNPFLCFCLLSSSVAHPTPVTMPLQALAEFDEHTAVEILNRLQVLASLPQASSARSMNKLPPPSAAVLVLCSAKIGHRGWI